MEQQFFVCVECFEDAGIRGFIESTGVTERCSFCEDGKENSPTAPIDAVAEHINVCLYEEYDMAENHLPYEGGFLDTNWDTYDLLLDEIGIELPNDNDGRLLHELITFIDDNLWSRQGYLKLSSQQSIRYSWEKFSNIVMYSRRFFFMDYNDGDEWDDDIYSPSEILKNIFEYAKMESMFVKIPSGTELFRARFQDNPQQFQTVQDIGPPPQDKATQSNRMSPPGIVMFYVADNPNTALCETFHMPGEYAIGRFKIVRDALIMDMTSISPIPSLFQGIPENMEYNPRQVLHFLHHVALEMSKSIDRDSTTYHIDYVPTQVVTEYIRSQVALSGVKIDGIKYASSIHDGNCYVLFATQDNMVKYVEEDHVRTDEQWIELVEISRTTYGYQN